MLAHNYKLSVFCLLIFTAISQTLSSDIAGIEVGLASWNQKPQGSLRYFGTEADVNSDFGLDKRSHNSIWLNIEHPATKLPRIGIATTSVGDSAHGTASSTFYFGNLRFYTGAGLDSDLDIRQSDLLLYYKVFDNRTSQVDLGLALRYLDGRIQVYAYPYDRTISADFSGLFPMLHSKVKHTLPIPGFSLALEGEATVYSGHVLSDIRAKVVYRSKSRFGAELGYRYNKIKLDNLDSFTSDLVFKGTYFGISKRF